MLQTLDCVLKILFFKKIYARKLRTWFLRLEFFGVEFVHQWDLQVCDGELSGTDLKGQLSKGRGKERRE